MPANVDCPKSILRPSRARPPLVTRLRMQHVRRPSSRQTSPHRGEPLQGKPFWGEFPVREPQRGEPHPGVPHRGDTPRGDAHRGGPDRRDARQGEPHLERISPGPNSRGRTSSGHASDTPTSSGRIFRGPTSMGRRGFRVIRSATAITDKNTTLPLGLNCMKNYRTGARGSALKGSVGGDASIASLVSRTAVLVRPHESAPAPSTATDCGPPDASAILSGTMWTCPLDPGSGLHLLKRRLGSSRT